MDLDSAPTRILAVTNLWPASGGFQGIFVAERVVAVYRQAQASSPLVRI